MRARAAVLAALAVLAACRPSGAPPAPVADSAPVATIEVGDVNAPEAAASATATATAVASASASTSTSTSTNEQDAGSRSVTAIARLAKITLEQAQGGPSAIRCNGIAYSVSVDLAKNEWTYGLCVPTAAGRPTAQTPLSLTTGKLKPEQRARLDNSYTRMSIETARGCGHDGGALTLRLDRAGAATEKYVDENWGCKKPAPEIAKGVKDFATTMMLIVNAP